LDSAFGQSGARDPAGRRPLFDRYLAANFALWALTWLLTTVRVVVGMDTPLKQIVNMGVRRALVSVAAALFCILIQKALRRTRGWPLPRRIALASMLAIAGGIYWSILNFFAFYSIAPLKPWEQSFGETVLAAVPGFSVLIWSFIAWCAFVFAMDYDEQAREQSLRLVQAQALAAESQNQMLRYQINPHFLFNTLNALSSLILQKDFVRAERMVLSLSNFLRASLEKAPGDKISLAEELEAQRQYLGIEQERFGERLRLSETLPASLRAALVPGLILQPLIENAVKYGVARTAQPVSIEILAEDRAGRLVVTVRDDAVPDIASSGTGAPQTLGVGLTNVRRRLAVLYGEAGVLTCGPRLGGGWAATIELPLERR
jgi:two-component sensor histidine kinase